MSEGQLQQVGTPSDVYDFPNSRFTAEFIGETEYFRRHGGGRPCRLCHYPMPRIGCAGASTTGLAAPPSKICSSASARKILIYTKKNPKAWAIPTGRKARWKKSPIWALRDLSREASNGSAFKKARCLPYWYVRNITPPTWEETVYINWPENQPTPLLR